MTAEEIDEIIQVLTAFKEGKEIEIEINGEWLDYNLMPTGYKVRVKPQPEYVPYTIDDVKDFINEVVVTKYTGERSEYRKIIMVTKPHICLYSTVGGVCTFGYKELVESHFKLDGTPFGKLKQ